MLIVSYVKLITLQKYTLISLRKNMKHLMLELYVDIIFLHKLLQPEIICHFS